MRVLPAGDAAILVDLAAHPAGHSGDPAAALTDSPTGGLTGMVLGLHAALAATRPPAVTDLVPAEGTLLIRFDPRAMRPADVARWVRDTPPRPVGRDESPPVDIPVTYDGEDLAEVGRLTGLGPAGVVAAHAGQTWTVAFTGFVPGFGYLVPEDPADVTLRVPRRDVPRVRVPAGAVALAAGYTGVYPRPSPGGWRLIGRTAAVVWDTSRQPPALLQPGGQVRFVVEGPAGGSPR